MAKKKGGLGRGLDLLFEETAAFSNHEENGLAQLPLAEISPDPEQPRKRFDETALAELASSILEHGVLQPIVVRATGLGRYTIIAGERRWRAARLAGLTEIPAVVRELTDSQAMEIALIENLQREDLDPVEEAMGYRQLMERCGYTQETAAAKIGKSRSAVANSLRILNLTPRCLELLRDGALSTGHAKALLSLSDPAMQDEAAEFTVQNKLSVRQTEALCRKMSKPQREPQPMRPPLPCEVELSLAECLGTQVKVQYKDGKGSLQVHFNSDEQLRAFANLLGTYEQE